MSRRLFLTYAILVERGIIASRTSLSYSIKNYGFPRPYKMGKQRVVWDEAEVEAWLDKCRPEPAQ